MNTDAQKNDQTTNAIWKLSILITQSFSKQINVERIVWNPRSVQLCLLVNAYWRMMTTDAQKNDQTTNANWKQSILIKQSFSKQIKTPLQKRIALFLSMMTIDAQKDDQMTNDPRGRMQYHWNFRSKGFIDDIFYSFLAFLAQSFVIW